LWQTALLLPVGELAGEVILDRALPFPSPTLGDTEEGALPIFSFNREQASPRFLLSSLSHGFEPKFHREIENPLWVWMSG